MQLESQYKIELGDYGPEALYVYPETQIHMDGHPEIAQMLKVVYWGRETVMLTIMHPLGQTNLKVRIEDLMNGINFFLGDPKELADHVEAIKDYLRENDLPDMTRAAFVADLKDVINSVKEN